MNAKILGKLLRNLKIYNEFREIGFDYIVNPDTGELHRVQSDKFLGSHNLTIADLETFIGLTNVGILPIHSFHDGTNLPIYDLDTLELLGTYELNKCRHCFPASVANASLQVVAPA